MHNVTTKQVKALCAILGEDLLARASYTSAGDLYSYLEGQPVGYQSARWMEPLYERVSRWTPYASTEQIRMFMNQPLSGGLEDGITPASLCRCGDFNLVDDVFHQHLGREAIKKAALAA